MTTTPTGPSAAATGARDIRLFGPPLVWLLLAAVLVGATAFAWTTPATAAAPELRPYTVDYAFDYGAELPANPVYDADRLAFGDTVFLSVVDRIDVEVGYAASPTDIEIAHGTLRLKVVASSSAGWSRVLEVTTPVELVDQQARATVPVDFGRALQVAREVNDATGTTGELTVTVEAEAVVDGRIRGISAAALDDRTTAELGFVVTAHTASPTTPADEPEPGSSTEQPLAGLAPGTAGASTETGEASSETGRASSETGVASSETGAASRETGGAPVAPSLLTGPRVEEITQMVPTDVARANRVSLGLATVDVSFLRQLTTPLALVALGLAAASLVLVARAQHRGEVAYIAARHGARLVPVDHMPDARVATAMDLGSFDALRAVSLELEQLIMVHAEGEQVTYYVTDGASTYRYRTTRSAPVDEGEGGGPTGAPTREGAAAGAPTR